MSEQWSDILRERMEAHQEPFPEGLWVDIERAIKQNNSNSPRKKQHKIILWSKRVGAVAAVVLVTLFIGDYFLKENPPEQTAWEKQTLNEPERIPSTGLDNERNNLLAENMSRVNSPVTNNTPTSTEGMSEEPLSPDEKSELIVEDEEKGVPEREVKRDNSQSGAANGNNADINSSGARPQDSDGKKVYDLNSDLRLSGMRGRSAKWEAGVYASNISSESTKRYKGYGSLVSPGMLPEMDEDSPLLRGVDPYRKFFYRNKYREIYTDIRHKQPVTLGVSLHYHLNRKWSLTSGLNYTMLSSDLKSGSANYYYKSEQTLHNIGIPLNISYNIWCNKKMSVYASGGGQVEKNVYGKLTTDYFVNGKYESSRNDQISIDRLQWSLNTSLGVQYDLSSKIGLYLEPGVSYYFKNGNEVETIYKEKPFNLNLRLGLRFSINDE